MKLEPGVDVALGLPWGFCAGGACGGGAGTGTGKEGGGGKEDPLKSIPKSQIAYWERLGYTRDQMVAEAPYVKARPHRGFV